jgi:hypothetical protein
LFALYNVRYVLCWAARRAPPRACPNDPVGVFDKFALFASRRLLVLSGDGRLGPPADPLSELEPEDGAVAIKFHWLETLRTDPPRPLEPFPVEGEPAPFLRVRDVPERLEIYDAPRGASGPGPTGDAS